MFSQASDSESRVFDLSDGRVLFYAAGRAYYVKDHAHAERLEKQLKWTHNLSTLAIIGTILASQWVGNWWLALGALPILGFMAFAEHFVVFGCSEATDPAARDQVTARNLAREVDVGSALFWPALLAIGPFVPRLLRGRIANTPLDLAEIALIVLAVTAGAVKLLRQVSARQRREIIGEPRTPSNTPIVPH